MLEAENFIVPDADIVGGAGGDVRSQGVQGIKLHDV